VDDPSHGVGIQFGELLPQPLHHMSQRGVLAGRTRREPGGMATDIRSSSRNCFRVTHRWFIYPGGAVKATVIVRQRRRRGHLLRSSLAGAKCRLVPGTAAPMRPGLRAAESPTRCGRGLPSGADVLAVDCALS
jgi:hypothetical protein